MATMYRETTNGPLLTYEQLREKTLAGDLGVADPEDFSFSDYLTESLLVGTIEGVEVPDHCQD